MGINGKSDYFTLMIHFIKEPSKSLYFLFIGKEKI